MDPPAFLTVRLGSDMMNNRVDHGDRRRSATVKEQLGTVEEQLRGELDDTRIRLYGAVDAARGAEAEKANALGLVRDLEYQVHMLQVEIDGLRAQLADSGVCRRPAFDRVASTVRRLASGFREGIS